MNAHDPEKRYIPLTQLAPAKPVLLFDSHASLQDLHAIVEHRVALATRCLDAFANLKAPGSDENDFLAIAGMAHVLMQEACDVNQLIERRLRETDDC